MLEYTISPEPDEPVQVCDCVESDSPLEIQSSEHPFTPTARNDVGCIGIIGGADGPTVLIVGQQQEGRHHAACSALHFEPQMEPPEWCVKFEVRQSEPIAVPLIQS